MPRPQFTDLLPMGRAASFFTFTAVSLAPSPTTAAPALAGLWSTSVIICQWLPDVPQIDIILSMYSPY